MGATRHRGTPAGALTPICNSCMVFLCWDIAEEEYDEARAFWDAWICRDCNKGEAFSLKAWKARRQHDVRPEHL